MKLALVLTLFAIIYSSQAENECVSPWQKVNDNICLFLNSITKTWSHSKFLCRFYGGELLYVQDENEQEIIQTYLSKLIKYRFNKKQFVWLDTIDRFNDGNWIWSRNNESVGYNKWINDKIPVYIDKSDSNDFNCACLRLKDGSWKDCDCSLSQHFVCRKSDRSVNLDIVMTTTSTTSTEKTILFDQVQEKQADSPQLEETEQRHDFFLDNIKPDNIEMNSFSYDSTTAASNENDEEYEEPFKKNNFIDLEEVEDKRMIISTRVLMDDEDKLKKEIIEKYENIERDNNTIEFTIDLNEYNSTKSSATKLLKMKQIKKGNQPIRKKAAKSPALSTLRIIVEKHLSSFSTFFCPNGFGYYLVDRSNCQSYRTCENWDNRFAVFNQYECGFNKIFSLSSLRCVSASINICDPKAPTFVSYFINN